MIEIIPDNTCPPDFVELTRRSARLAAFSPRVQLDVGDGVFVPETSWPYLEGQWAGFEAMVQSGQRLPFSETLEYEVHLMVNDPVRIGELLAQAGCKRIIPHVEVFKDEKEILTAFGLWKAAGASEVGLTLLIQTPLSAIATVAHECDVVQLMSISKLGYQGMPFEPSIIERIKALHGQYPDLPIEIDGGVSQKTIPDLVRAGATLFSVGSAISKAEDPKAAYEELKALAENAASQ